MRPRRLPGLLAAGALAVPALLIVRPEWTFYGVVAGALLGVKILASLANPTPRQWREVSASLRRSVRRRSIAIVVPYYNEDAAALVATVSSLGEQRVLPAVVVLVNDGSTVPVESPALTAACADLIARDVAVVRLDRDVNLGKRVSLAEGIRHPAAQEAEIIVTVDSDTVLHPDALANALLALVADRRAAAVTGMIRVRNWRTNILTRLQDVRYTQSFLTDRAAYSLAGSVLCVCGSFTMWRGPVLRRLVDDFLAQQFLGRRATYGDDRHLTNLALRLGYRVRFTPTAVAETLAPERLGHFLRQQVRWSKSFLRESFWAITRLPPGRALLLSFFELFAWWALSILLAIALVSGVLHLALLGGALLVWLVFTSMFRSVRYLDARRPDQSVSELLGAFALAPVYGLVHFSVILPIKFFAFVTLFDMRWGSRSKVEVRAA